MPGTELLRQAEAALRAGDPVRAARLAGEVLRARSDDVAALMLQGMALRAGGRHADACSVFARLVRLQPQVAAHRVNLGTSLRDNGRLDEALTAYAVAASLGAKGADFLFNVGLLHKERGDYEHAWRLLREAREAAPLDADINLQFAQCCQELLRLEEAARALSGWESFTGLDADRIAQLALQLLNLGDKRASDAAVQRLLREPAPGPAAVLRLGQVMERNNRVPEARDALAALLATPLPAELREELQLLEGQVAQRSGENERAAGIFTRLAAGEPPHRRHMALFPLARAQQSLGHHEAAWKTLQQAHAAQMLSLARTHPDVAAHDEPPLLIIRRGTQRDDFARWRDAAGPTRAESPVFIVAFPRSGTTLLEQALDSHPGLASMDEQPFLQQVIDRMDDMGADYPVSLANLDERQLVQLREYYWTLVRGKVELAPGQRLVDKNPLNLLRLPAIRRLFPRASVILAIRHPLDVVLSCYTQHFRAPEFALLCRDPDTLARGFRRCFGFWYAEQETLHADVLEVRYEDLVADFESGMRGIAGFLHVPWHEAMVRPADRAREKGFISTPSYAQVIEPVNTRAIGKWQPYRALLAGAARELAPLLSRWNYVA
jgi:tetratricopeptide (TPR) repeat protein